MMKDEMILYRKRWDPGNCSCMTVLLLVTFLFMMVISYFSDEKGALEISFYSTVVLILILLAIRGLGHISKQNSQMILLTVSEEGLRYYAHPALIPWKTITDIQIINHELSVSVGASPVSDFTLNLMDTDLMDRYLKETFDDFCQLINRYYYPKTIYIYETSVSCGC